MTDRDPTLAMRERAASYEQVDEGTACTQASFKTGKKSFFFVGEQGGRFKAMFKLGASKAEAIALSEVHPEDFQAGSGVWVTARFSADAPMEKELWQRWLDESYALSRPKPKKRKK